MRIVIALPLLLLTAAAAPPPDVPVYRSFGRWFVACDNTRACEARGFDDSSAADLRVVRQAGAAAATVILSAAEKAPDGAAIRLDGAPLALVPPAWTRGDASTGNPAQLSADDPAAVRAFIARVREGHSLKLAPGDEGDAVPLDGFTAALLFMDAAQGRPGTPTALVAPTGPGTPLPPLPLPRPPAWQPPAKLSATETRALATRARTLPAPADTDCDSKDAPDFYALDAATALVLRPCHLYAYQGSSLVYTLPRTGPGPAHPVALPLPGVPKGQSDREGPEMVEAGFDPATGQLSTSAKGRGPADCGMAAGWVWSGGAFNLVSLNFQDQCGGSGPGDWPTLFRSAGYQ